MTSAARLRSREAATCSDTTTSCPATADTGVSSGDDVNVPNERPSRILSLKRRATSMIVRANLGCPNVPNDARARIASMANLFEPEWVERSDAPLRGRTARVGATAGAKQLGATLYEIDPGQNGSPFHLHHGNEEMIIVLSGSPTLRTIDGVRALEPG